MARYFEIIPDVSFIADGDLSSSTYQYCFVALSSCADDKVYLAKAASAPYPIGVLQNSPCSGEEARVRCLGFTKLRVDTAAIADWAGTCPLYVNNFVQSGSLGVGVKAACVGTGEVVSGRVISGSLSSGSGFVHVLLLPMGFTSIAAS